MLRRYSLSLRSLVGLALVASVAVVGCGDDDDDSGAAGSSGSSGSAGSSSVSPLCQGVAAPCVGFAAGASEQDVADAVVSATEGTTFVFGEGTFAFTNTISVGAKNVTIRGQGMDRTVLDFKGQVAGAEGINVQDVPGFTIEDLHVRDTKGDGVKVTGGQGVTFRRLRVEFTAADATSRGAYGIYPVQCDNVLIESCEAIGASDAGIYVGQSRTIIVRNNTARGNVAGIEVENCYNADVTGNTATENVGGILVFDLPGLPQLGGHDVRVYKNQIFGNNTPNFAPQGNIVGSVPAGTGVLVMANRNVEIFDNDIKDNQTAALAVASYAVSLKPITDDKYYQWPRQVYVHDNRFAGNGKKPDPNTVIGGILASEFPSPGVVPELLIDGNKDPKATSDYPGNPQVLCFKNNTSDTADQKAAFSDLAYPDFGPKKSSDITPFSCELPPVAAVVLPSSN